MSSFKRKVKAVPSSSGSVDITNVPLSSSDTKDDDASVVEGVKNISMNQTGDSPGLTDNNSGTNNRATFQSVTPITGWKPWVHTGLGIVSSGHRQLDDLLGGGVPLGTTSLYLTENYSAFGQTLFAYNVAEGLSHGHNNLIIVDNGHEAEKLLRLLPLNLNLEKIDPSLNNCSAATSDTSVEQNDSVDGNSSTQPNYGLKIAWQYEKYLKKQDKSQTKSLTSEKVPFCCSYDLSKRIQESLLNDHMELTVLDSEDDDRLDKKLNKALNEIMKFLDCKFTANPSSVCRIYIPSFHDIIVALNRPRGNADYEEEFTVLGRFLIRLKRIVRDSRVAIFFSVNDTMLNAHCLLHLHQVIDTVLSVESFAGKAHVVPYEFREYLGFFTVKKLQQYGVLAPYQPPKGTRFGIKRDRRKLHIEPLHLPPEESRAFGSNCSSDTNKLPSVDGAVSKPFGSISAIEKSNKTNVETSYDHGHSHSHGHNHDHHHNKMVDNPSLAVPVVAPTPAINSVSTNPVATNAAPKSSLAASLAAARQSRLAAKQGAGMEIKPISISRSVKSSQAEPSNLDF